MIKVRHVFETNSSSAHSLVISNHEISQSLHELGYFTFEKEEKTFHVSNGETAFGWSWIAYSDAVSKANYLYLDGDKARLRDIIKNKTNADHVIFDDIDLVKDSFGCFIDHQSAGTSGKIFAMSDDDIWRFIMNDSAVCTGNDNTDGPWTTYDEASN